MYHILPDTGILAEYSSLFNGSTTKTKLGNPIGLWLVGAQKWKDACFRCSSPHEYTHTFPFEVLFFAWTKNEIGAEGLLVGGALQLCEVRTIQFTFLHSRHIQVLSGISSHKKRHALYTSCMPRAMGSRWTGNDQGSGAWINGLPTSVTGT